MHERYLCVVYNDGNSSYDELLNLNNSVSMHHRSLQILATEMFWVNTGSATDILNKVLPPKSPSNCNLRNQQEFTVRPMKTVHCGFNSLAYLEPKMQEFLPNNLKRLESVETFKYRIKRWIAENYPCKICRRYIYQVGLKFISMNF